MTDKDKLAEEILKTPQEWCKDCVIGNHHRHETKKLIKLAIEAGRQIGYGEGYEDGKRNVLRDILKHGSWLRVKELAKELKVKR